MKPFVIAVNAVSGGGKTTLAKVLSEALPAKLFRFDDFDDFDETNVCPMDYSNWYKRGAVLEEFDCPGMHAAVMRSLEVPSNAYVVLDYPFGRDHHRFRDVIDLSVFIDTPLDLAMARRILRDYETSSQDDPAQQIQRLRAEMAHYIDRARLPFIDTLRHRETADLVLDGCQTPDEWKELIIRHVPGFRNET